MSEPEFMVEPSGTGLVFHGGLRCFVDRIEYDPRSRVGAVYVGGIADMTGCARIFETMDPRVEKIRTFTSLNWTGAPYQPSATFTRDAAGTWRAKVHKTKGHAKSLPTPSASFDAVTGAR